MTRDEEDPLARYDLADAQALIDDVTRAQPLIAGRTYLALVHQPATTQKLLAVRELPALEPDRGWTRDLSDLLFDEVHQLPIPPRSDTSASILVTIVVRSGTNGWGWRERLWASAWRYSNHNSDAFDRDIFVVTEHGWCSLWSEAGGTAPAMAW